MELAHRKSFGVSELFDLHNTVELIQQHVYVHVNRHGPDYEAALMKENGPADVFAIVKLARTDLGMSSMPR